LLCEQGLIAALQQKNYHMLYQPTTCSNWGLQMTERYKRLAANGVVEVLDKEAGR
jgi:hypothetical protein